MIDLKEQQRESAVPATPNVTDLIRKNEALKEQYRLAEAARDELSSKLAAVAVGSAADRDLRRAALNLMEDAVAARRAGRKENDERRRVEEELRQADRRKDEFLATLAHELRGPLAPVRNGLNVMRRADVDDATRTRLVAMIDKQVSHIVRLVDDLLEVSRITRGRVELRTETVSLASLVQRAVEACAPIMDDANHTLEVTMPDEPLFLEADPMRITQILSNLLNNAAKYTRSGGRISLSARRDGDSVLLAVKDTGAGIPADMLPRIFDLFTQVDRTYDRAQGGLGIGLTLARRLVEMHGGHLTAESEGIDRGSTFTVSLPLSPTVAAESPSTADLASADDLVPRSDRAARRVLVVDDNEDSTETLGMLIEALGHPVMVANDGLTALEALRTFRPSIVFLDIGMPGMDGYEVARRARQLPEGQTATLVALTGWGQREDRERSRAAGFDHHLVKPIAMDALEALLASEDVPTKH